MIWSRIKDAFLPTRAPHPIEVVRAYGAILEDKNMGLHGSKSVNELPHDKAEIKLALMTLALVGDLTDEEFNALGVGYVELASFQHDGGGLNPMTNLNVDWSSMSHEEKIAAALTLGKTIEDESAGREDLGERILAEMRVLSDEWNLIVSERRASNA